MTDQLSSVLKTMIYMKNLHNYIWKDLQILCKESKTRERLTREGGGKTDLKGDQNNLVNK